MMLQQKYPSGVCRRLAVKRGTPVGQHWLQRAAVLVQQHTAVVGVTVQSR